MSGRLNGHTKWIVAAVSLAILTAAGWAVSDIRTDAQAAVSKTFELEREQAVMKAHDVSQEKQLDRLESKVDLLLRDRGIRPPQD